VSSSARLPVRGAVGRSLLLGFPLTQGGGQCLRPFLARHSKAARNLDVRLF
jgi:hypothetical protein